MSGKSPQETFEQGSGRSVQHNNILAARLVAETVRSTLGPKGMDKMLVDPSGDITVTNDGVTILERMDIQHPTARMIVAVARTQEDEIGDGTTTAVILAGELLKQAEALLEDRIHPTIIIRGYRHAQERALAHLKKVQRPVTSKDRAVLTSVAQTAMTGKGAEEVKEHLAQLCVEAIGIVGPEERAAIKIATTVGGSIEDSALIKGIVLEKEPVHPNMPTSVQDARILLLDKGLELQETETRAQINISDPEQMQGYLDMEERMLDRIVARVQETEANVVFCQKGIDDLIAYRLAKHGVLAARRVKKSDLEKLALATGATIITDLADADTSVLGAAQTVSRKGPADEPILVIEGCANPRAVTLLLRAGTQHVVEEVERAVSDAIGDLRVAVRSGSVVAGAGAIEMRLARALAEEASKMTGREQLAVEAFSRALEAIPRTLAENAGLDTLSVLAELRGGDDEWRGVDAETGRAIDAWEKGIIEPVQIKIQALSSATDVAAMILRIDDVISTGGAEES